MSALPNDHSRHIGYYSMGCDACAESLRKWKEAWTPPSRIAALEAELAAANAHHESTCSRVGELVSMIEAYRVAIARAECAVELIAKYDAAMLEVLPRETVRKIRRRIVTMDLATADVEKTR